MNDHELTLSEDSNIDNFFQFAIKLEAIGARFTEKVNGLDQRYWDFQIDGKEYTLHLEHYLGISIFGEHELPKRVVDELLG